MFKPLPADPVLIQKLRIRNRVASLVCFGLFIGFPIVNSFIAIPVSNSTDYEAIANYSALMLVIGFANAALMIPASVFFFGHALRYKKLLGHLATNPAVFAATEPAPTDLKKLRGKKTSAIVWHSITLGAPLIWAAAAATTDFSDKGAALGFVILGTFLVMSALAGGMVLSATAINNYLTFKAQLRWAFPDAQAWSTASTTKTS
jgi:hypothetical protein